MKNLNRYSMGLALGLGLFLANLALAQTITQSDQKKAADSCCAMACCSHDSTVMKDSKEHSAKQESCCSGDSCSMKMKENARNQAAGAGCCGGCGDSCDMKMKDGAKNHADHSTMAGCCGCCGDSREMNMKEMKHKEKTN